MAKIGHFWMLAQNWQQEVSFLAIIVLANFGKTYPLSPLASAFWAWMNTEEVLIGVISMVEKLCGLAPVPLLFCGLGFVLTKAQF